MSTYWTLLYAGTEKSFASWGFEEDSAQLELNNQAADMFSLTVASSNVDSTPGFPFEAQVVIYRNRISATGADNTFGGGSLEFVGKRTLHILDGRPNNEGITYQFVGPWYDLDQTPYLQPIQVFNGFTGLTPTYLTVQQSEYCLFQSVSAGAITHISNGQQITNILQSLLDQYAAQSLPAPFQIGTIAPAVLLPSYQVKDMKCTEAIQICMRSSPDCVFWVDYTTTSAGNPLPTINVSQQGSATAVIAAFADGVSHESMKLTPRYDLQARNVTIIFKQDNSIGGTSWIQTQYQQTDNSGSTGTISVPTKPIGGLRGVIQTIDLTGFTETDANATLDAVPFANTQAFWQQIHPELASARVRNFAIVDSPSVIEDGSGAAISLGSFPNWLRDGTIASWMTVGGSPVVGKKVTIKVHAAYDVYDNDSFGNLVTKFLRKELEARITLTNGISGNYSTILSFSSADPIPTGLSTSLYNALATLQYQGTFTLIENETTSGIRVGNVLNLSGGLAEWTTMNALVQQVTREYGRGKTTISLGPAAHLNAADLTQIFLVNRYRYQWKNPTAQASAVSSSASNVTFGANVAKENTFLGLPEPSHATVFGPDDGVGGKWLMQTTANGGVGGAPGASGLPFFGFRYINGAGALDPAKPSVQLDHNDLITPVANPVAATSMEVPVVKYYKVPGCMTVTVAGVATVKQGYWLMPISQFYPNP